MAIRSQGSQFRPGGVSTPATLVDWLVANNLNSFYARWLPGQGMAALSDGSGTVADLGSVGCWAAMQSSNWTAKFIQASSGSRPQYSTSASSYGPSIVGNGTSWSLYLDSATALNQDCTILISAETPNAAGYLATQNGDAYSIYTRANQQCSYYYNFDMDLGDSQAQTYLVKPPGGAAWTRRRKIAFASGVSTSRYGNVLRLLAGNGAYWLAAKILEVAIVPKLTADQQLSVLPYLV